MRLLPAEGVDSGACVGGQGPLEPGEVHAADHGRTDYFVGETSVRRDLERVQPEHRRHGRQATNIAGERDVTSPRFAMFARCMGCKWMRAFGGVLSLSC